MAAKKNARSLNVIAGDIHKLERNSIFDIGDLLIEAKEQLEHGQWGDWLEKEFDYSDDTAENYMNAARLAAKNRTVRNLNVPARIIYVLADSIDDDDTAAVIDALDKAARGKRLKAADAKEVIRWAELRFKFGDHPEPIVEVMEGIEDDEAWRDDAINLLAKEQPRTDEAAEKIITDVQRGYVAQLFKPWGTLPAMPAEALSDLEGVAEGDREKVLQRLTAAPQPLSNWDVRSIVWYGDKPEDDAASDDTPPADAAPAAQPPVSEPKPRWDRLSVALHVVLEESSKPVPLTLDERLTSAALAKIEFFVKRLRDREEARGKRTAANGTQAPPTGQTFPKKPLNSWIAGSRATNDNRTRKVA